MVLQDLLLSLPVSGDAWQALLIHGRQPRQRRMGWPCPSSALQEGNLESEPALGDGVALFPLMLLCPALPSGCHVAPPVNRGSWDSASSCRVFFGHCKYPKHEKKVFILPLASYSNFLELRIPRIINHYYYSLNGASHWFPNRHWEGGFLFHCWRRSHPKLSQQWRSRLVAQRPFVASIGPSHFGHSQEHTAFPSAAPKIFQGEFRVAERTAGKLMPTGSALMYLLISHGFVVAGDASAAVTSPLGDLPHCEIH